ncbi:MAG: flagellar biosynthetic protein FliQ [Deltaproteobacteria bacterium]|nr:flagellar biosynthetic protein FliQ [Deltaproteobacteria bacterium]
MNTSVLLDLWREALVMVALVGGPFVLAALAVGLLVSVVQAATQLQESVLTFAPKLLAVGLVLILGGHWLLEQLCRYVQHAADTMIVIARSAGH